jgi:hypothetical protein
VISEVDLVAHDEARDARRAFGAQGVQRAGGGVRVDDQHGQVGAGEFGARAADAFGFDLVGGVAQAGGVDQGEFDAVEADRFAQDVAVVPRPLGEGRGAHGDFIPRIGVVPYRA